MFPIEEEPPRRFDRNRMLTVKPPAKETLATHSHLKYDEKGVVTDRGVRFTDRSILGQHYNSRIVGVKVWADKSTFALCGLQCIYRIGGVRKLGGEHVRKEQAKDQLYSESVFEVLDDDYVKHISGALSAHNTVEYLVLMSAKSKVARYGVVRQNQKQFNFDIEPDELPVCMYGSLAAKADPGQPKTSTLEFLGFEIMIDSKEQQSRDYV